MKKIILKLSAGLIIGNPILRKFIIKLILFNKKNSRQFAEDLFKEKNAYAQLMGGVSKSNSGTSNLINREAWLKNTLLEIPEGKKILDAGAGELQYKKFCSHLEYISQDFGKYDGKGNSNGLQMQKWDNSKLDIVSDIVSIPVADKSFDAIMCIEVFEHLPEPAKAVKEFSRIIKKDGMLIITAPFCSLTHFAPFYFANGYSKYWYEKILSENDFKIEEIVPNGNYFEYLAQEMRRIPEIAEKYSSEDEGESEKIASDIILAMLERFSKKDTNSSEILNYGFHVKARKIN